MKKIIFIFLLLLVIPFNVHALGNINIKVDYEEGDKISDIKVQVVDKNNKNIDYDNLTWYKLVRTENEDIKQAVTSSEEMVAGEIYTISLNVKYEELDSSKVTINNIPINIINGTISNTSDNNLEINTTVLHEYDIDVSEVEDESKDDTLMVDQEKEDAKEKKSILDMKILHISIFAWIAILIIITIIFKVILGRKSEKI